MYKPTNIELPILRSGCVCMCFVSKIRVSYDLRREGPHSLCDWLIQDHLHLARVLLIGDEELEAPLLEGG